MNEDDKSKSDISICMSKYNLYGDRKKTITILVKNE